MISYESYDDPILVIINWVFIHGKDLSSLDHQPHMIRIDDTPIVSPHKSWLSETICEGYPNSRNLSIPIIPFYRNIYFYMKGIPASPSRIFPMILWMVAKSCTTKRMVETLSVQDFASTVFVAMCYYTPNMSLLWLVGGLEPWNFMNFHIIIGNVIIPTDELIFFRGVETNKQIYIYIYPLTTINHH